MPAKKKKKTEKVREPKMIPEPKRMKKRSRIAGGPGVRAQANGTGVVRISRANVNIMTGKEDLTQWSDEDLIRGYRKGMTRGHREPVPKVIPREVFEELCNRILYYAKHTMVAELRYAVEKHIEIIKMIDSENPTGPQIKAIEMLYERVLGKPTEHVAVYSGGELQPWQQAVATGIVGSAEDIPELEEGEIVDEPASAND
jgi:hypothetical protein